MYRYNNFRQIFSKDNQKISIAVVSSKKNMICQGHRDIVQVLQLPGSILQALHRQLPLRQIFPTTHEGGNPKAVQEVLHPHRSRGNLPKMLDVWSP